MQAFLNILLSLALAFGGIASQADFVLRPARYNAKTLVVSDLPEPAAGPRTDAFVQLSEVNVHYQVYGSGERSLILVHGNGGSADSLREAAAYLANDCTVYVPESRCHGESSDPGEIT